MVTYPVAHKYNQTSNIMNVIENYGYLYYKKEIKLTKNGIIKYRTLSKLNYKEIFYVLKETWGEL